MNIWKQTTAVILASVLMGDGAVTHAGNDSDSAPCSGPPQTIECGITIVITIGGVGVEVPFSWSQTSDCTPVFSTTGSGSGDYKKGSQLCGKADFSPPWQCFWLPKSKECGPGAATLVQPTE